MRYKVISLFSGCGGLDLGFKQAGFELLWANDIDADSCRTYEKNLGDEIVQGNIRTIAAENIPDGNVVLAGFPCQPFSSAGKEKGTEDYRGTLFEEVVRVVKRKKPEMFILENVPGLKGYDDGETLDTILSTMNTLGYKTNWKILSADNFGVPQERKRLFISGWQTPGKFTFPLPNGERNVLRDVLPNIPGTAPNQEAKDLAPQARKMIDYIPEGGSWKNVPYEELPERFQGIKDNMQKYKSPNMYRRYSYDEPNGTITAAATPENCGILHPKEDRRYTVREIAAIQTFPHDFEFTGGLSSQYRQIGNAVPPKLSKVIAERVKNFLDMSQDEKRKTVIKGWLREVEVNDTK